MVDEVLAVGDAEFQKKCFSRMSDIAEEGRTILFVSHNLQAVQRLCTKGLLLSQGKIQCLTTVSECISTYTESLKFDSLVKEKRNLENMS